MSAEQTTEYVPEPRCYGHVFDPAHESGSHDMGHDGWPAHTWEAGPDRGWCRWCVKALQDGDRYVCIKGGVMHAACVADLDASLTKGADRG